MSQEVKSLDVQILGRDFRVSCTQDEEPELLRAVEYLDRSGNVRHYYAGEGEYAEQDQIVSELLKEPV